MRSRPDSALQDVLDIFTRLEAPVYHMLGNHCLYCHSRPVLNQRLGEGRCRGFGGLECRTVQATCSTRAGPLWT